MNVFQAIVLGSVQGIAEWLPISSEAMVTLVGKYLLNLKFNEALSGAIWLHLGTFFSALFYFRRDIIKLFKEDLNLLKSLIVATTLTGIIGLPLMFLIFNFSIPDAVFTIFIGIFLVTIAILNKNKRGGTVKEFNLKKASVVGAVQGLAILPGFSRSGLTISTLLAEKFSLKEAFKISFLMSLPATFGVQLFLPLIHSSFQVSLSLIIGAFVSFLVGIISIKKLMDFAKSSNFFKATLALGIITFLFGLLMI